MELLKTINGEHADVTLIELQKNVSLECLCTISDKINCLHKKRLSSQPETNNLNISFAKVAIRNAGINPLSIKSYEWQGYWMFDTAGQSYQNYPLCDFLHDKYYQPEDYRMPGFQLKPSNIAYCYLAFHALSPNTEAEELKLIIGQEFYDFKFKIEKTLKNHAVDSSEEANCHAQATLPQELQEQSCPVSKNDYRPILAPIHDSPSYILGNTHATFTISPFHQILIAHELTLKRASNDMRKMEFPLSSAMVDLNPHQIDAGLFAFREPMSKGAILCDEVGLGKTIEAGLIICQLWAEGKRKIIVVVPASIRKQWQNELLEKFSIPCVIVDGFEYRIAKKNGNENPFDRNEVVITSIPFASRKSPEVASAGRWDLVVIDEAHRLRNVYKKTGSIQAKKLKEIFTGIPKILLTATPLQNTLMELYGLVSFIDERIFGSEYAFKVKFIGDSSGHESNNLELLKERISSIAIRTIRRQVREYIPYTNRISMIEDFTPTDGELELYEQVSEYLQRPVVCAIPTRQRHLMILIYRKILASSSFAIAKTLQSLVNSIEKRIEGLHPDSIESLVNDVDGYEDEKEEIAKREEGDSVEDLEENDNNAPEELFSEDELRAEREELLSMKNRAESINKNAKGDALLIAVAKAFSHARKMGWSEKAVVFTESRRTQEYLLRLFSDNGYKDQITIFNGTNESPIAKRAYALWEKERVRHEGEGVLSKAAVIREALIHEFKHHTKILISTEAGAEGINLQFCNIVINYDLPWNPQRVEQRIGRCHRYGQKNDVVVLNFLNRSNAADERVFELLDRKFRLFNGVFGASDEILGAIGSGVDFERRVLDIYQTCRTEDEINTAFDRLQEELSEQINQKMLETRTKLLEHFDDEVRARFKVINKKIREDLSAIDMMLARLIISALKIKEFNMADGICKLQIDSIPKEIDAQSNDNLATGQYYIGRYSEDEESERLHLGHNITNAVIRKIKEMGSDKVCPIRLCYTEGNHKISQIEPYVGKSGFWAIFKFVFEGLDTEEHLMHVVLVWDKNEWIILGQELAEKIVTIMAKEKEMIHANISIRMPDNDLIESALTEIQNNLSEKIAHRNEEYYDAELDKLDIYTDEVLLRLYDELKEKEVQLSEAKKKKQRALSFAERQEARKNIHKLELAYSHLADKITQEKRQLFEDKNREMKSFEKKLKLKVQKTCIAKASWVME